MISVRRVRRALLGGALALGSLLLSDSVTAQTTSIPSVSVVATAPLASWSGAPGTITLIRNGDASADLNVYCRLLGTATNGVDYQAISNFVTIPAGTYSNSVTINPINNGQTVIKTVTLALTASPMMIPVNYSIGWPSNATVFIKPASLTNIPPYVKIATPAQGAVFYTPTNIPICAYAYDVDGFVSTVEFFAGTTSLGIRTNNPMSAMPANPFCLVWSNPPAGTYALTAVATDDEGATTTSEPVNITVNPGPPPPVTNIPPVVKLTSPMNGAVFNAPANISLIAVGSDSDGAVTSVEFFNGATSLGVVTNFVVVDPLPWDPTPARGFFLTWSNVPVGTYTLMAKATDDGGATSVSGPITVTVQTAPPVTNIPPVVRITSPPNGAVFRAPVDIPLFAYANDQDGSVSNVEFFAGTNDLGPGHGISAVMPLVTNYWSDFHYPTNLFVLVWSNAPLGSYTLTAVATDNGGASTTSPGVNISVLTSPPPPTNFPALVSIVASDPLAIEGTNCWPWLGLTNPVPTWSNWNGITSFCRWFTNCGPKDASFTVRRYGETNDALVLQYEIGGTATNGVDYVPLSGTVTIPAGERRATVSVVPLDDGAPDITSTVVLKLLAGTNYLVGLPSRAAAVILDSGSPRPITGLLPDDTFQLSASGPDGAWFHIEYSGDLTNWTAICTNQVVNGQITFVDPDAASHPSRFYRAVPEAAPPAY